MPALRKKQSDQERWQDKFGRRTPHHQESLLSLVGVHPTDEESSDAAADKSTKGRSLGPTVGPKDLGLAPKGKSLGPTVGPNTKKRLRTDRRSQVSSNQGEAVLLAPLQWEVLQVLKGAEASQAIISVRQIAHQVGASIEGVKKAIRVLKQVEILKTSAVRTAEVQGVRVQLETTIPVRKGTLNETRGVGKRLGLRTDRWSQALRTNPPRMYVCKKNTYIQEKDLTELLQICPAEWKIREATLIAIADTYPEMDKTTFRLSLLRAVEQAREGKSVIRKANAWLKAAFEQNGAPLLTTRDIEARVTSSPETKPREAAAPEATGRGPSVSTEEAKLFRRYLAADAEQRRAVDRRAEEKMRTMQPILAEFSPDRRHTILVQAQVEAARDVLAPSARPSSDAGEGNAPKER